MTAILLSDIISYTKQNVYGFKGDIVVLIYDFGNGWIVEGKKGRFPVNKRLLEIIIEKV